MRYESATGKRTHKVYQLWFHSWLRCRGRAPVLVSEERADRQQEEYDALLFEAVLFLNVNSSDWNECTVKEAMDKVKSGKVQNRLEDDTQH